MSQILVWKSDADGKLFEDKEKYVKHLRMLANQRAQTRRIAKAESEFDSFLTTMGNTVTSIDDLKAFIHEHWDMFFANGMKHSLWKCDKRPSIKHKLVCVGIDVTWSDEVSNSHSCPRNGVQNFDTRAGYNKGKPTSYPGWQGHIVFVVDAGTSAHKKNPYNLDGYGSGYFAGTTINTGSGGGDGQKYNYDVKLFAADFPAMALAREQQKVWDILTDKALA